MAAEKNNNYFWKNDRWNGGWSEDSRIGTRGSARFILGGDFRSDSGLLRIAHKVTKISDSIVDQLAKWIEPHPTNGDTYAYAGDEIYKITSSDVFSLARTISAGTPNGQGLAFFKITGTTYLFYRTGTTLGRFDLASTWDDSWQTGLVSVTDFGKLLQYKNLLLVANGRYVGTIDDVGTVSMQRLALPDGWKVRDMFRAGTWVCIIAIKGNVIADSNEGMAFFWDGTKETYNDFQPLDGNPHAGAYNNGTIVVIAGVQPQIYHSLGGKFEAQMGIPAIGEGSSAEVWPGAIDFFNKMIHFGISDGDSTTVTRAVWNWGRKNALLSDALNAEYVASPGTSSGTGLQIGAIRSVGTTLFIAWKAGSTYGIDKIDFTQYQSFVIWRSLAFDRESPYEKNAYKIMVELGKALEEGESVSVKLSTDPYGDPQFQDSDTYETASLSFPVSSDQNPRLLELPLTYSENDMRSRDLQLEVYAQGDGSSTPEVKRAWVELDEANESF